MTSDRSSFHRAKHRLAIALSRAPTVREKAANDSAKRPEPHKMETRAVKRARQRLEGRTWVERQRKLRAEATMAVTP